MTDPVRQIVPLGMHWPTIDPFLFCAHHNDAYPAGDERCGPATSLAGRNIGSDFDGIDGWNMYHGSVVPGFPQHPHRGFETVTLARRGLIDHSDSLGATARFGRGDVQWVTAGSGIVHCEMFPLVDPDGPNHVELFQIWLNLPAENKLVDPHFTMLWDSDIPRRLTTDDAGRSTEITVIAGALGDAVPPSPPPNSWASQPGADVAIWHLRLEAGAEHLLAPAAGDDTVRVLYFFEGTELTVGDHVLTTNHAAVLDAEAAVPLRAGADGAEAVMLQGRPIGEPVARYGPFVMNTEVEIEQAFLDYRRTEFGGWPWPVDDPIHDRGAGRFARHADGRTEAAEQTR